MQAPYERAMKAASIGPAFLFDLDGTWSIRTPTTCCNTSMKSGSASTLEAERKLAMAGQLSILSRVLFYIASKLDTTRP